MSNGKKKVTTLDPVVVSLSRWAGIGVDRRRHAQLVVRFGRRDDSYLPRGSQVESPDILDEESDDTFTDDAERRERAQRRSRRSGLATA